MTVDELKELLGVDKDAELATMLHRGPTSVSNWRRNGEVPQNVVSRAQTMAGAIQGFQGNNNNIQMNGHSTAECQIIQQMINRWDEKKRKKLLRIALELDDE